MLNDRLLGGLTIGLVIVGVCCIGYVLFNSISKNTEIAAYGNLECVTESTTEINRDASLEGFFKLQEKLKFFKDYYNCNNIERDHAVLYQFSKSIPPVVRVVRGIPGDRYEVTKRGGSEDEWDIKINNELVPAANGRFFIKSKIIPPLKTYADSRKGVLRDGEYILFSNNPPSISDSSNLGLVKPSEIVGRAVILEEN